MPLIIQVTEKWDVPSIFEMNECLCYFWLLKPKNMHFEMICSAFANWYCDIVSASNSAI